MTSYDYTDSHVEIVVPKEYMEPLNRVPQPPQTSKKQKANMDNSVKGVKSQKKSYKCCYCEKEMASEQSLTYHINEAVCFPTLHTCGRCFKSFKAEWMLSRHQRSSRRCEEQDKVVVMRDGNSFKSIPFDEYIEYNENKNDVQVTNDKNDK